MSKLAKFTLSLWVFCVTLFLVLIVENMWPEVAEQYGHVIGAFFLLSGFTISSIATQD